MTYIPGDRWVECEVCGFGYRHSQMRKGVMPKQKGLWVCPPCFDFMHKNELWKLPHRQEGKVSEGPVGTNPPGDGLKKVATPTADPTGTVETTTLISLSCTTVGANIHYTIGGSTPDVFSSLYSGPFTLSSSTTVKAKAYHSGAGWTPSDIMTELYTIESDYDCDGVDGITLSWTKVNPNTSYGHIYSLCHDYINEINVAGYGDGGLTHSIYRSSDGQVWTQAASSPDAAVVSMAFDSASGTLVAGTKDAKIWTSSDGGVSWAEKYTTTGEDEIWAMSYDSANGKLIAGSGSNAKIWVSSDSGDNWTNTATLTGETDVLSMAYDSGNGVVIAGTSPNGQLWVSSDSGSSWTKKKDLSDEVDSQTDIYSLAVDTANDRIIAGTAPGAQAWVSSDIGETWSLQNDFGSGTTNVVKAIKFTGCDYLYASIGNTASTAIAYVYDSKDGGDNWTESINFFTYFPFAPLRVESLGWDSINNVILAGTWNEAAQGACQINRGVNS